MSKRATVTFYLSDEEGTAYTLRVVKPDTLTANQLRDAWAEIDEVRLDLPDHSHASWPVVDRGPRCAVCKKVFGPETVTVEGRHAHGSPECRP